MSFLALGLRELFDTHIDLGDSAGRANVGLKAMTLVHSALARGDSIDDADMLRAGATAAVLGHAVRAPSTLGTFLRSFTWGHARQLDKVAGLVLGRAWAAGAGPGDAPVTIDVDSTICETYGLAKQGGTKFTYTHVRGYHPLIAAVAGTGDIVHCRLRGGNANTTRGAAGFLTETFNRARTAGACGPLTLRADSGFYAGTVAAIGDDEWTPIPYFLDGADVAETVYRPFGAKAPQVRLIVRRVKPTPGSQLELLVNYAYHPLITDRAGDTVELEADHRRHAVIEDVIRDLKYGVGLNHLPSGRFAANTAWPGLNVIAHNLARWTSRLGLQETVIATDTPSADTTFTSPDGSPAPPGATPSTSQPDGWNQPPPTATTNPPPPSAETDRWIRA